MLKNFIMIFNQKMKDLHNLPPLHQVAEQDGQGHYGHTGQDAATNDLLKNTMKIIMIVIIGKW